MFLGRLFNQRFAIWVSLLLSYPIIGIFEILFLGIIESVSLTYIFLGILLHAFIPVVSPLVYGLYNEGDFFVTERKERPLLFIPGVLSYCLAALIFYNLHYQLLFLLELVTLLSSLFLMLFSFKMKVSIHVTSITVPVFFLILIGYIQALFLSPMILLVCWSRLRLEAHNFSQVILGFILGVISTFLPSLFLLNLL